MIYSHKRWTSKTGQSKVVVTVIVVVVTVLLCYLAAHLYNSLMQQIEELGI